MMPECNNVTENQIHASKCMEGIHVFLEMFLKTRRFTQSVTLKLNDITKFVCSMYFHHVIVFGSLFYAYPAEAYIV